MAYKSIDLDNYSIDYFSEILGLIAVFLLNFLFLMWKYRKLKGERKKDNIFNELLGVTEEKDEIDVKLDKFDNWSLHGYEIVKNEDKTLSWADYRHINDTAHDFLIETGYAYLDREKEMLFLNCKKSDIIVRHFSFADCYEKLKQLKGMEKWALTETYTIINDSGRYVHNLKGKIIHNKIAKRFLNLVVNR